MNPTLEVLIELQRIDGHIVQLEATLTNLPERLKELDEEQARLQAEIEGSLGDVRHKQAQVKELDLDIKSCEQRLKIADERLLQIKTNAEYQAMLKEIALIKQTLDRSETDFLKISEELETLRGPLAEKQKEIEALAIRFDERRAEWQGRAEAARKRLEELRHERAPWLEKVTPNMLREYESTLKIRRGQAVVGAFGYICKGCHMSLPPHMYNQVIAGNTIERCPACKRYLYFDPPTPTGE